MIASNVYVLFIASVLVMQVIPGPDTLFVVSNGIYGGYRRALLCASGFTMAGLIQIPIIVFGMGEIIRENAPLYDLLCLAGASYLLYMGYGMMRNAHQARISVPSKDKGRNTRRAVWGGFVNNLLNPKVIVFMLAVIPLFVDPQGNVPLQLLVLAVTMKLCGLAVNSTYAAIGGTVSRLLQSRQHILSWQRALSGVVVMLLGAAALALNPVFGWSEPAHLIKGVAARGAQTYEEKSRYTEAEKRLATPLARAQASDPLDTRLATTLNELGLLYRAQHKYTEAELALRRAAAIWEQARGPERVYAATALNNLAVLYHLQRRDNEAESLFKRALEVEERTLGAEHPQFAAGLTNLAVLYYDRGEYGKAEELYRRALATQERALGLRHPDLAATLQDYAEVLRKLGRSAQASQIGARAQAIRVEHAQ